MEIKGTWKCSTIGYMIRRQSVIRMSAIWISYFRGIIFKGNLISGNPSHWQNEVWEFKRGNSIRGNRFVEKYLEPLSKPL